MRDSVIVKSQITSDDHEQFAMDFIDFIELIGCSCGGAVPGESVIECGHPDIDPILIRGWLEGDERVSSSYVSPPMSQDQILEMEDS